MGPRTYLESWPLRREIACGASLLAVALVALIEALGYSFGTIDRIGPGFLPVAYSMLLAGISLAILWQGRSEDERLDPPKARPLLTISAAVLLWAYLAPRIGFVLSTTLLVLITATGDTRFRSVDSVLLAIATASVAAVVFITGFAVPLPAWPWR